MKHFAKKDRSVFVTIATSVPVSNAFSFRTKKTILELSMGRYGAKGSLLLLLSSSGLHKRNEILRHCTQYSSPSLSLPIPYSTVVCSLPPPTPPPPLHP